MKWFNLFFCLYCFFSFSQNETGVITYRLEYSNDYKMHLDNEVKKNPQFGFIKKIIDEVSNEIRFELTFCEDQSLFKPVESLFIEKNNMHMYDAVLKSLNRGDYYTTLGTKKIVMVDEVFGKKYSIDIPWPEWTIKSESKQEKILNYNCFEAETRRLGTDGKSENKIIAWFSPEINISFGPNGYARLPGLILKLELSQYTLIAEKISFTKKCGLNKISTPKGTISYKEFLDEVNEINKKMRR